MRKTVFALVTVAVIVGCKKEDSQPVEVIAPGAGDVGATAASGDEAPGGDAAEPAKAAPVKRFIEVAGDVTIDGQPATVGGEVGASSTIKTGKESHAIFTLGPDSIFEMKAGSSITLGKSERKETSVKLALGSLWSFLPKGSSYEVTTENAVAGVRGTIFFTEATPKATYICACDGEVSVQAAAAKKPQMLQSKHEHKSVNVVGKAKAVKKAGLVDHTDAEAAALIAMMDKTR